MEAAEEMNGEDGENEEYDEEVLVHPTYVLTHQKILFLVDNFDGRIAVSVRIHCW